MHKGTREIVQAAETMLDEAGVWVSKAHDPS